MIKKITISVLSVFILSNCSEDTTLPEINYGIEIIEPSNNFILGENQMTDILLKIEYESEIEKVLVYRYYPSEFDTFFNVIFNKPFKDTLRASDVVCVDSVDIKLFAKAFYKDGKEVVSNTVSGIFSKGIPPNGLLGTYNYIGYDLDSNLVAEGTLYLNYDPNRYYELAGRKNIESVNSDSAYEKGEGIVTCVGSVGQDKEFDLSLTICTGNFLSYSLHITGIWNDTLLTGDRFTYELGDPPFRRIDLGTYMAVKIQ
ncbi:MAG: hypothetical protein ACHQLA_06095 [Ignavibacteriales bacterium]